jgi:hypothetical protein
MNKTKNAAMFLLKYPGKWHSYATNKPTVEIVCALVNLGIAKVNQFDQFRLKSIDAAERYTNN